MLAELTGLPLTTAPNKFAARGSLDGMVAVSSGLRGVAVALMKIANDMRWLASGPRAGLHELELPANEPGSSIMPGKVNPTQQEAMVIVCLQVIGEDAIVAAAGAQGNFELNAMRPIIINNVLHSAQILGDAAEKLREFSIEGTNLDREKVEDYVGRSLMLITVLSPRIGYDRASAIAHKADDEAPRSARRPLRSGSRPLSSIESSIRRRWSVTPAVISGWSRETGRRCDATLTLAPTGTHVPRELRPAVLHSVELSRACFASYWLTTRARQRSHPVESVRVPRGRVGGDCHSVRLPDQRPSTNNASEAR